jgi:hypothetical protein
MEGTLPFLGVIQRKEGRTGANYFGIPEGGITPADKADIQAAAAAAADIDARLKRQVANVRNLRSTVNNRFNATNQSMKEVKSVDKVQAKQIISLEKKDADLDARLIRQLAGEGLFRSAVNNRLAATNKSIKEVKSVETVQEKQIATVSKTVQEQAVEGRDARLEIKREAADERGRIEGLVIDITNRLIVTEQMQNSLRHSLQEAEQRIEGYAVLIASLTNKIGELQGGGT